MGTIGNEIKFSKSAIHFSHVACNFKDWSKVNIETSCQTEENWWRTSFYIYHCLCEKRERMKKEKQKRGCTKSDERKKEKRRKGRRGLRIDINFSCTKIWRKIRIVRKHNLISPSHSTARSYNFYFQLQNYCHPWFSCNYSLYKQCQNNTVNNMKWYIFFSDG